MLDIRFESRRRAFTLMEVIFCLLLFLIGALSLGGSILYARKTIEINKQRMAAMNLCRKHMEAIMGLDSVPAGTQLVPLLNSSKIPAQVTVEYYGIKANGEVDPNHRKMGPSLEEPTYARVSVAWRSVGVYQRNHHYSLQSLVTKGLI